MISRRTNNEVNNHALLLGKNGKEHERKRT